MNTNYNNLADKTAADMAADHICAAYRLLKTLHPEIGGFTAELVETGNEDEIRTKIGLLHAVGVTDRKEIDGEDGYIIVD